MTEGGVELEGGERLEADQVVLATEVDFAAEQRDELEAKLWRSVSCLYFAAPEPPIEEPILVLNGEREAGPVNNLCVPSQIAPTMRRPGRRWCRPRCSGATITTRTRRSRGRCAVSSRAGSAPPR